MPFDIQVKGCIKKLDISVWREKDGTGRGRGRGAQLIIEDLRVIRHEGSS